ncbi:MAG: YdeI/OmpD-associated family protein [Anaerolineales bacterium]|nr:MAG: YdeI/OmpD-associated family protein [Anaerolineales bacterium]
MEITKTLYHTDRKDWREWLKKNYKTEKEIWLVYPRKATGKPRIEYNDAVEEALCFGWIDSIVKKLDEESTVQRFSPRKPKTKYSQANLERLRYLVAKKKVVKEVAETLGDVLNQKFVIPPDILNAIKANKVAWKHFQKFSDAYKRIRVAFIHGARHRPEEFKKRLRHFVEMTEKNKLFGFGGIEKHY